LRSLNVSATGSARATAEDRPPAVPDRDVLGAAEADWDPDAGVVRGGRICERSSASGGGIRIVWPTRSFSGAGTWSLLAFQSAG
jgi:hypothetical protein